MPPDFEARARELCNVGLVCCQERIAQAFRAALEEAIELTKMNAKHEDRSARRLRKRGSDLGYQHRIARDALNANAAAIRALLAEPEKDGSR